MSKRKRKMNPALAYIDGSASPVSLVMDRYLLKILKLLINFLFDEGSLAGIGRGAVTAAVAGPSVGYPA
jgi:hypothetical protein